MNDMATAGEGRAVARRSALMYTGLSLVLAVTFFAAATLIGSSTETARIGGAVWVFMLSMIVTVPLVTSFIKKRAARQTDPQ
jgi:hypothetical protein